MKKLAIIVLVILLGVLSIFVIDAIVIHTPHKSTIYERQMIVTMVNYKNDIVTLEDISGNLWDWYGVANWKVGDECLVTMNNKKTKSIYDDEIIQLHEY